MFGSYKIVGLVEKNKVLAKKLNLILDHLNLSYVPEKETKEPAKLVKKSLGSVGGYEIFIDSGCPPFIPKKKRGRPKKK